MARGRYIINYIGSIIAKVDEDTTLAPKIPTAKLEDLFKNKNLLGSFHIIIKEIMNSSQLMTLYSIYQSLLSKMNILQIRIVQSVRQN